MSNYSSFYHVVGPWLRIIDTLCHRGLCLPPGGTVALLKRQGSYCMLGRSQTLICFSDTSYLLRNIAEDSDYFIVCVAFEVLVEVIIRSTFI